MSHSINAYWMPMKSGELYLYVCSNWRKGKRMVSSKYSAQKHGLLGAIKKCIEAREKSQGKKLDIDPQQVLDNLTW